jgi:hypothetical protein
MKSGSSFGIQGGHHRAGTYKVWGIAPSSAKVILRSGNRIYLDSFQTVLFETFNIMLLSSFFGLTALATSAFGASLQQVRDFGNNPTKIYMYIYVPDKVATKPAIIVAVGSFLP